MSKKTRDNRNVAISSDEEYEEAKKRLKYYKDEYKWITGVEDKKIRIKEVNEEAQKIKPMINAERNEEQLYYRKYYNTLTRKKNLIESGNYATFLIENMTSVFVAITQYEIDSQDYTLWSIVKGVLKRDRAVIDKLKMNRILSRFRMWVGVPKEKDPALQSVDELLANIDKYCNLVGIKIPEQSENNSLLPAISEGYLTPEQKQVIEMLGRYINDEDMELHGISTILNSEKGNETGKETDLPIGVKENKDKTAKTVDNRIVIKGQPRNISGQRGRENDKQDDKGEISE